MKKFDLEERLTDFSISIIEIVEQIPNTKAGNHLSGQLIRSGTSPIFDKGIKKTNNKQKTN